MTRKLRAALIGAAALVLLAPAGALAKTFTVEVGPPGRPPMHLDLGAFFPPALTVHAGDSVRFQINGFHTVSYLPPAMAPPPLAVPDPTATVGDLRDAAGRPFWFDSAPKLELNPTVALPAGNGLLDPAAYANSGLTSRTKLTGSYMLRFAHPGTFRLYCLVHRGMSMLVRVVSPRQAIPSVAQVGAGARRQLRAALRLARRLEGFKPPRLTVLAGHDAGPVDWMRFFSEHLRIRAGRASPSGSTR